MELKALAPELSGKILDVGCGWKPYKKLFTFSEYIGIDVEQEGHPHDDEMIDVFYDGKRIPFENETFDSVVTTQVFEHIFTPNQFLSEINRVLKPGGKLILTVPFVWDEHEQPYDYARYSSFGLKHLLSENSFQVLEVRKTNADIRVIFQLFNAYVFKITRQKPKAIKYLSIIFFIGPSNLLGEFLSIILPKNNDLYLDNIILAIKGKDENDMTE